MRAARDSALGDARVLAVISPHDYADGLPDFVADDLPPRWMVGVSETRTSCGPAGARPRTTCSAA